MIELYIFFHLYDYDCNIYFKKWKPTFGGMCTHHLGIFVYSVWL